MSGPRIGKNIAKQPILARNDLPSGASPFSQSVDPDTLAFVALTGNRASRREASRNLKVLARLTAKGVSK